MQRQGNCGGVNNQSKPVSSRPLSSTIIDEAGTFNVGHARAASVPRSVARSHAEAICRGRSSRGSDVFRAAGKPKPASSCSHPVAGPCAQAHPGRGTSVGPSPRQSLGNNTPKLLLRLKVPCCRNAMNDDRCGSPICRSRSRSEKDGMRENCGHNGTGLAAGSRHTGDARTRFLNS
ncbi:hypothetical protein HPB50_004194 [Hyalomma asiaticum]|uniref:Uncharacterized protein n=1 Tax=Hyalomma asiaticum TaxID=266040 RepID=A0ACB7SSJ0_HYAAI|nr:hypothetical protein HPB50_004194 [Hyalomma asiaticum]